MNCDEKLFYATHLIVNAKAINKEGVSNEQLMNELADSLEISYPRIYNSDENFISYYFGNESVNCRFDKENLYVDCFLRKRFTDIKITHPILKLYKPKQIESISLERGI